MMAVVIAVTLLAGPGTETSALLEQLHQGTPTERRAAALRLGEIGDQSVADHLARALRDTDPGVRGEAQDALWALWHRSGDPEIDALLRLGIVAMSERQFAGAVVIFSEVIERAPTFAEGWNKRATVYYLMGEYDRSLADCEEVIQRNPIHFGALSGFGLNYLEKGDLQQAARYFERALAVNPNLERIEAMLEQIRERLRGRRKQFI